MDSAKFPIFEDLVRQNPSLKKVVFQEEATRVTEEDVLKFGADTWKLFSRCKEVMLFLEMQTAVLLDYRSFNFPW